MVSSASNQRELDVGALLQRAWKLFVDKPVEHIVAGLIVSVLGAATLGILLGPLLVGYIRMCHKQWRGEPIAIGDVFGGMDSFVPALLVTLIVAVVAAFGLSLFVLPGLVVIAIWYFALWFVALKAADAIGALGASFRLFKAQLSSVIIVLILLFVLSALGGAAAGLGVLVTLPYGVILATLAFEELTS